MIINNTPRSSKLRTLSRFLVIVMVLLYEGILYLFYRHPVEEHLYRIVIRLGPTFIKLAQVASTRPDFVPEHISVRFKSLQEHVPPFAFEDAKTLIETELDQSLTTAFETFSSEPVASASLSQVHLATLSDGRPVVVKVQRPNIERLMRSDLAILGVIAWLIERVNRVAHDLKLSNAVAEFGRWTLKELDFETEAHNAEVFRQNFAGWDDVIFPEVYWSHTSHRVLTMQRVSGLRVDEVPEKVTSEFCHKLAKRLAEIEMKMFITDAFFHADLHPGNIFFQPDGCIAIIDLGMVGQMTSEQRDRFLAYWVAISRRDRSRAFYHLLRMALSTENADLEGFRASYDISLDRFYDKALSERSLAQTYLDIVINGARFGVIFPSEMILQAKAVVTAEALDLVLAPDFRFADEVRAIVASELAQRAKPNRILDRLWDGLTEWILLGESVPVNTPNSGKRFEESEFRKEATVALLNVWLGVLDMQLSDTQERMSEDNSASYWSNHPEYHTLLDMTCGLAQLVTTSLERIQQESHLVNHNSKYETSPAPIDSLRFSQTHWLEFIQSGNEYINDDEMAKTIDYLRDLVSHFDEPDFWQKHLIDRAGLLSTLTFLRFWFVQLGKAINENLNVS